MLKKGVAGRARKSKDSEEMYRLQVYIPEASKKAMEKKAAGISLSLWARQILEKEAFSK